MKLRLKEDPKEWVKFTAVMLVFPAALLVGLWRRHRLGLPGLESGFGVLLMVLGLCVLQPRWFRGFYRGGMTVTHAIGQLMGTVLLTLFFLLLLTPLGWLLKLMGKDLLGLKRPAAGTATYWKPSRGWNDRFDRQF